MQENTPGTRQNMTKTYSRQDKTSQEKNRLDKGRQKKASQDKTTKY